MGTVIIKAPPAGSEAESQTKSIWGVSCAILCNFTHLSEHFESCLETSDSYTPLYRLVGLREPRKLLSGAGANSEATPFTDLETFAASNGAFKPGDILI